MFSVKLQTPKQKKFVYQRKFILVKVYLH